MADLHIPYQDEAAVEAALAWGEKYRPSIITILGDLIDIILGGVVGLPGRRHGIRQAEQMVPGCRACQV